jgi:anaerobic magnesium-protoporphyrin IX monomethyl ester cyclase
MTDAITPRHFRHVLCVYPYRYELKDLNFLPPLGLEYIAAVLAPYADNLDVVDLRREKGQARDFLRSETDLVCFSINWDFEREFILAQIRSIGPGVTTIVGGRHATEAPEAWLNDCPDVMMLARGDGEEAVEEYCRGVELRAIAGISYRQDGRVAHNPNRMPGPIHEALWPDRGRRRYDYAIGFNGISTGLGIDLLSSSRGCPFNCSFCSFSRNPWGVKRRWSARSAESVVDELAQIKAPMVAFTDDLFTYDLERVERICDLIAARGIHKKYIVNARLELARRPDILRRMEKAGFMVLLLGIESTQDETLKSMRKGFDIARIRYYFRTLRKSRMFLHGYFILGNVGETVEQMLQIAPFAHELGLDSLSLSTLRASPFSGVAELVAASPGYHLAPGGKVYSDHCSARDLRHLRRRILRQFYSPAQCLRLARKGLNHGVLRILPVILGLLLKAGARSLYIGLLHILRIRI